MNLCLRIVFKSLWLFFTPSLLAQPGLSLPFLNNVSPGATLNFPLKVTDFDSIVTVQFVICWNPQVLQYVTIDNFVLPDLGMDDFNVLNALDSGMIRLGWVSGNLLKGATVADQTAIFRLRLKAIGAVNTGSAVSIGEAPPITLFEIARTNYDSSTTAYSLDDVEIAQGFAAIGYTVAAAEPSGSDDLDIHIFPNPFFEKTQLRFDLKSGSDAQISVTDAAGRTLWDKRLLQLPPGQHGMEIASPLLRQKGTYFLTLRTETQTCIRPLIVL